MKFIAFIATSSDGFIARKNGDLDWLPQPKTDNKEDYGYSKFISKIDTIIMGRNTFEKVAGFDKWPYKKPVIVISTKIKKVPPKLNNNKILIKKNPDETIQIIKEQKLKTIYVDGGKTIRWFIKNNLLDEIIITIIPIKLETGIKLFTNKNQKYKFLLKDKIDFENGIIQEKYLRKLLS